MGTSKNPAKAAEEKRAAEPKRLSSPSDFKKKRNPTVELPSGWVVKLINPGGIQVMMSQGLIPNSLMPSVQKSLDSGKPMETPAASEIDPAMIEDMMGMMDQITIKCFQEPRVFPIPTAEEIEQGVERDEELLYVDEVEDNDKLFIFQWLTSGNADVERFREEQKRHVAPMAGQPAVGSSTE